MLEYSGSSCMDSCDKYYPTPIFEDIEPLQYKENKVSEKPKKSCISIPLPFEDKENNAFLVFITVILILWIVYKYY